MIWMLFRKEKKNWKETKKWKFIMEYRSLFSSKKQGAMAKWYKLYHIRNPLIILITKKTNLLLASQNEEVSLCNRCPWKKSWRIFSHHTEGKTKEKLKGINISKKVYHFIPKLDSNIINRWKCDSCRTKKWEGGLINLTRQLHLKNRYTHTLKFTTYFFNITSLHSAYMTLFINTLEIWRVSL
jgi:hypothetical protein